MSNFKENQVVRCIRSPAETGLIKGDLYLIKEAKEFDGIYFVKVFSLKDGCVVNRRSIYNQRTDFWTGNRFVAL